MIPYRINEHKDCACKKPIKRKQLMISPIWYPAMTYGVIIVANIAVYLMALAIIKYW